MRKISKDEFTRNVASAWHYVSGNATLSCAQMAFAFAESVGDELPKDYIVSGRYDEGKYVVVAKWDGTTYTAEINIVRREDPETGTAVMRPNLIVSVEEPVQLKSVSTEFETIKAAMKADRGYAWSWHCNFAVPIQDAIGSSHKDANEAAARLMQHIWDVDVTVFPEYTGLFPETETIEAPETVTPVVQAEPVDPRYTDGKTNHVYVSVEGFDERSGAEDVAKYLDAMLRASGVETLLRLPITDESIATAPVELENTLVTITGIESRPHTDGLATPDKRVLKVTLDPDDPDPERTIDILQKCIMGEAADSFPLAQAHSALDELVKQGQQWELGDPDSYGAGAEDPGVPGDDLGDCAIFGTAISEPRMTLRLKLDKCDMNPSKTIEYFRTLYPHAELDVSYKVEHHLTDHIHSMTQAQWDELRGLPTDADCCEAFDGPPDTGADSDCTDMEDPDRDADEPGLQYEEVVRTTTSEDDMRDAYVLRVVVAGEPMLNIQHVDVKSPDFSLDRFYGKGISLYQPKDYEEFKETLKGFHEKFQPHVAQLFANSERWFNTFGDYDSWWAAQPGEPVEEPFTLWTIPQNSIPKDIYQLVESCWTDWNSAMNLPALAAEIDDETVVIPHSEYLQITKFPGMIVREHPRAEELFLKLLKVRALSTPEIADWLKLMGK